MIKEDKINKQADKRIFFSFLPPGKQSKSCWWFYLETIFNLLNV
jgi:hypothetical protein